VGVTPPEAEEKVEAAVPAAEEAAEPTAAKEE